MAADAREITRSVLSLLRPPGRMTVSKSATAYMRVGSTGNERNWDAAMTPYMTGPMDRLSDRTVESVIFCGPAQSGKSDSMVLGWMTHSAVTDPCDMMIVQMTQHEARDFVKRRIDRTIQSSPALRQIIGAGNMDNVFDKRFKNGAYLSIGWPTISQLSSKPIKHMMLTDYDRMPLNVDGEGEVYALARNRTKSFMSRGKTLVESTPGHEVLDPEWKPTGHGAPPTHGVLKLFNQGDRHRWYWHCPHCNDPFLAEWDNLKWDTTKDDFVAASKTAHMLCPNNGCMIFPEFKDAMNAVGVWRSEAEVFGTDYQSKIASYWLQGPAAVFQSWEQIVYNYLNALKEFEVTGNQESLKTTINTDQGRPYAVMSGKGDGLDAVLLKQRADDYAQQRQAPPEARFITTAVDVQKRRFVVQVMAWGIDGQSWIVDRYNLANSNRVGDDGKNVPIKPFEYPEDWNILDKLLDDEYVIAGTDVKINSRMIVCDSGGQDQATNNAYTYALRLKRLNRCDRFALLKGASTRNAMRIAKGKPGDDRIKVPLWIINTTVLKDEVAANLARTEPGPNYIHLPDWIGEWFFKELTAETRTVSGWVKKRKGDNNEALDLCGYNRVAYSLCGGDKIDWKRPPEWAAKPLGDRMAEVDTVQPSSNEKYLQYVRERARKLNGD
jgi:phage terminase large subunit GpA-like protein